MLHRSNPLNHTWPIYRGIAVLIQKSAFHLVLNTGRSVAQNTLVQNREDAAAGTLADGRADSREVVGVSGNSGRGTAVEVDQAQDVSSAALSRTAAAGNVGNLAFLDLSGSGDGNAGNGGNDGSSEELHVDCGNERYEFVDWALGFGLWIVEMR